MVPIKTNMCTPDKYPIKCPYIRTPKYVVIHNTANDAPAENEIAYMLRRPEQVSFHYAVDDEKIIQALPLERNAWASSDGNGPGNMTGIHIEICYSLSGGSRFDKAEENAAELAASLLSKYGWGTDRLKTHWDFDPEKRCPHRTLDRGWPRFVAMVNKFLEPKEEEETVMSYDDWLEYQKKREAEIASKPVDTWAKVAWDKATKMGIVDGKRPCSPLKREEMILILERLGLIPAK